ncbi:MAG: hypothetical protein IJH64_04785 [Oscillospiraceae bacterium]|nr:hypothetical protein [Oscillospiraceae bacterium]
MTKTWYAAMRDHDDNDWGTGSYNLDDAKEMARNMGEDAYIAVIDMSGNEPMCIDEINEI